MRHLTLSTLALLTLFQGCESPTGPTPAKIVHSKIINGASINTDLNPAVAFNVFYENGRGYCSGSLVAPNVVLTAAHCLSDIRYSDIKIKMGSHVDSNEDGNYGRAKAVFVHPGWSSEVDHDDIAVIVLKKAVDDKYKPIAIFDGPLPPEQGMFALEAYGYSANTANSSLDMAEFFRGNTRESIQSDNSKIGIHDLYGKLLPAYENTNTTLAEHLLFIEQLAGGMCNGDSGGPMVININGEKVQIGINDSILNLVERKFLDCSSYAASTRVAPYLPWINEKLASLKIAPLKTKQFDKPEDIEAGNNDTWCVYAHGNVLRIMENAEASIKNNVCDKKLISDLEEYVAHAEAYCTTDLSRGYQHALKATIKSVSENCKE